LAQFAPGLNLDGPIYALPVVVGTVVPFYNRNALDSAGVAPNDGSWTWDTFFDIARRVRFMEAGEVLRFGVGGSVMGTFNALVASHGGRLLSEDRSQPVMNNEIVLNALETLADLKAENVFGGTFTSGSNVFHIAGDWDPGWWSELPFAWDIMEMPKGPKGGFTTAWSNGIGIPKGLPEERIELAWEFIKLYVMNPDRKGLPDIYLYMMPAYIPLAVSEPYLFAEPTMNRRLIVEMHMNNLIQVELTPNFVEWHDRLLGGLVNQAVNGEIPPSNALVQAEELIRERGLLATR